jgi:hypothetical protein
VILRVNRSSYEDIKRRIIAAGQPDRIFDDGRISVDEVAIEVDDAVESEPLVQDEDRPKPE